MTKSGHSLEAKAREAFKRGELHFPTVKSVLEAGGTERTPKGLYIDLNKAPESMTTILRGISPLTVNPMTILRVNAERVSVIKQLSGLGYKVEVPDYGIVDKSVWERISQHARIFKAEQLIVGTINKTTELHPSTSWARDLWQQFAGMKIIRFIHVERNHHRTLTEDRLGEGGAIVPINENATLISRRLQNNALLGQLESTGHKFYFLKDGFKYEPNISRLFSLRTYLSHDHVDLFVGIAGKVMLADQGYFAINSPVLRQAVQQNGLQIVFVPGSESTFYPANFLVLEENRIMMDKRAVQTISLLRRSGVEVIPTNVALRANMGAGGGIRCFTNEL